MLYSQTCRYAIRALSYLASQPEGTWHHVREVAEAVQIPLGFSGKILGDLARAGLLQSARGTTGGFALARPPCEITLGMIKTIVDGGADLEECAAGWDRCLSDGCRVHRRWKPIQDEIRDFLNWTTLAELSGDAERGPEGSDGAF